MSNKKGKVYTPQGTFRDSKGRSLTFKEALDEHAKCCAGISCCENLIRIKDQSTGETYTIQIVNGEIVLRNETTGGEDIPIGREGPQGPQGPEGPQGPPGDSDGGGD